jgi:hypothetical protein
MAAVWLSGQPEDHADEHRDWDGLAAAASFRPEA